MHYLDALDNNFMPMSKVKELSRQRRPGRPPRAGKASLERVEIRVTKAELLVWKRCARKHDMTLSQWLRWCAAYLSPDA